MTDDIWALRFEIEKAAGIARPYYLALRLYWDGWSDSYFTANAEVVPRGRLAGEANPVDLGTGKGTSMEAAMRDLLRVVKEKNK